MGYVAFHNGDYKKSIDIYNSLIAKDGYDKVIHAYKACCLYGLCQYKEAKEEASKADDCPLKTRLLLHLAHKLNDEKELMACHDKLTDTLEDQLSLAALHYLRSHFEEATEIYKKLLMDNKEFSALNVYVALCYYKLDYYDVSLEVLSSFLAQNPASILGMNLRACNHYQLYNGKTAEEELRQILKVPYTGNLFEDNDLLRHNLSVFRNGKNALQVMPPLIEDMPEAKLNLVIYHLKNDEIEAAFNLIKDMEPVQPKECILKGVVHSVVGQQSDSKEHLKIAQQLFQLVGSSATECDTIPGRQCMASCFFILRQFEDVLVYLKSIKEFFPDDDDFNWNYGIALAATGDYKTAEETLRLVKSDKYKGDYCFLSWLCKCYIMNGNPNLAWEVYVNMENSTESLNLLTLIANDCYKMGQFYYSAKAFDVLERLDNDSESWEGKRGASVGVFQQVVAGKETKDKLLDVMNLLKTSNNPQVWFKHRWNTY
jgi:intraflagellar transport protein 56